MDEFSEKSGVVAFVLLIFFGCFGIHNFYVGKIGKGVFYIFSFGGFFIGCLIDGIKIVSNSFRDKEKKILDFNGEVKRIFKR